MKMNKILQFILLMISPFITLKAQIFNNATIIKVQPNTLVYSTNGLSVISGGTMVNDGNVQVASGAFDSDSSIGSKIKNTFTSNTSYGQLILGAAVTASAQDELIHEHSVPKSSSFLYSQMAFPFSGLIMQDFASANGVSTSAGYITGSGKEYNKSSAFYFNNTTTAPFNNAQLMWLPLAYATPIIAGTRIVLNNENNTFFSSITAPAATTAQTNGIPNADNVTISSLYNYAGFVPTNTNLVGKVYDDYLEDNVRLTSNADYLKFGYNFGNPYNSNLDLSHIGINQATSTNDLDGTSLPVLAIGKMGSGYSISGGVGNLTSPQLALFDGGADNRQIIAGDVSALLIRPYEPFGITFTSAIPSFTFTQGMKTFSMNPKSLTDKDGNPGTSDGYSPIAITPFSNKSSKNKVIPTFSSLSFGLVVSAKGADVGSNATYVLANSKVTTNDEFVVGYDSKEFPDQIIYTLDNTSDGINTKHKINGIMSTEAKVISLGLRLVTSSEYTLSIPQSSLIRIGGSDLDYAKFFKLYDKYNDVRVDITPDFTYNFTQAGSTEDRFYIEYGTVLEETEVESLPAAVVVTATKIAQEESTNYLVIGSDISIANPSVKVYNYNGQLIDNFSTNGNKKVSLKKYQTGLYLVKVDGLSNTLKLVSK